MLARDAEARFLFQLLPALRRQFRIQHPDGIAAHEPAILHKCPVGNFIRIHRDAVAHFEPLDLPWLVIDVPVEPVAAEPDIRKPEMLDLIALAARLLYFKIVLSGDGMLNRLNEDPHRAARLVHRSFHGVVVSIDIEYLRLDSRLDVFAGQGMIRLYLTDGGRKQRACKNGGREMLHGLYLVFRSGPAKWIGKFPAGADSTACRRDPKQIPPPSTVIRMLTLQQRAKASLLEMTVASQRIRQAFALHHDE